MHGTGVLCPSYGLWLCAVGAVDVREEGKRSPSNLFSCPHNPLRGLSMCSSAVAKAHCDGTAEDTLSSPSVESCQTWGGEVGFPQLLQKVEVLLGFLCDGCGVLSPCEM